MIDAKYDKYHDYMRQHKIPELFEDLCTALAYKQPENVREFLIEQLQIRLDRGSETLPLFTEKEIENVFYLYNLKREKTIPKFRALEALKNLAHSKDDLSALEKERQLPEDVDLELFKELAQKIMGVSFACN